MHNKLGMPLKDQSNDENEVHDDEYSSDSSEFNSNSSDSSDSNNSDDQGEGMSVHQLISSDDEDDDDVVRDGGEELEEDEVVKAIRAAQDSQRDHPPDIKTENFNVDISFHPENDIIAVANMLGDVEFYSYSNEETKLIKSLEIHSKACRAIEYNLEGNLLFSTAKDCEINITDVETGKLTGNYEKAHEEPAYCLSVLDENLFATGDDNGVIKLWDMRMRDCIFSLKECDDYISDILTNDDKKYLVCSSGDGSLTTINMNTRRLHVQSEEYKEELTCLCTIKSDTKIVSGGGKGRLYTFNWNEFGLHCDAFPGPKQAVSCIVPITENIVVSSGEDGILRATHLCPSRHLGVVGQHSFPVESMDICNNGTIIASSCHNNTIKFWNIQYFEDFEKVNRKEKHNKVRELKKNLPSSKYKDASDFFAELA